MSGHVRPPAVAGLFYPADPAELTATVDGLLAGARGTSRGAPHAVVVPHAGYVYSGPVAAVAYRAVPQDALPAMSSRGARALAPAPRWIHAFCDLT
jgi:AmmeMemoRadiSam system protein B